MEQKRLVILANSIKHNARCIAGRELLARRGSYVWGPWVRPITRRGGGELDGQQTACACGARIAVMDIADVKLDCHAQDPHQPENWFIDGARPWTKVVGQPLPPRDALAEHPWNLWLDPFDARTDRIAHRRLTRNPPAQSLYVVAVDKLRIEFFTERHHFQGRDARRSRAVFRYRGVDYDLSLTDPLASARHCPRFPAAGAAPLVVSLGRRLTCVSLTGEFHGYHYKVLATVF